MRRSFDAPVCLHFLISAAGSLWLSGPSTSRASAAEPDALLVERLKSGDRQASDELIRRYQEKAFGVAFRMLSGDREEALDITQDAFLTALRKIDGFEGKSTF